jgi:hypothetical protein
MDSASHAVEAFLRSIHEVEWSMPGSPLSLTVKYRGDPQDYWCSAPPRDNPFTSTGLRDPALGNTGPISFGDIDSIVVNASPRRQAESDEYRAKFRALAERAASIPGASVSTVAISLYAPANRGRDK